MMTKVICLSKGEEASMTFGKTDEEVGIAKQKKLAALYDKEFKAFAWLPTKLGNGSYIWLEDYQYTYYIYKEQYSNQYWADRTFWLERIDTNKYVKDGGKDD